MRRPKKLTYRLKLLASGSGLDAREWLLLREDAESATLVSRDGKKTKTLAKEGGE